MRPQPFRRIVPVRHMFTKVRGRFATCPAIETEGDSLTDGQVSVEIDADSVDTNDAQRDGLRTNDFFGTGENPTITFRSTSVTPGATTSSWFRRPDDPRYHPPGHAGGEYEGGGKTPFGTEVGLTARTRSTARTST